MIAVAIISAARLTCVRWKNAEFDLVTPKGVGAADRGETHAERKLLVWNQIINLHRCCVRICAAGRNLDVYCEVFGAHCPTPRDLGIAGLPFIFPTAIHHADSLIRRSQIFNPEC